MYCEGGFICVVVICIFYYEVKYWVILVYVCKRVVHFVVSVYLNCISGSIPVCWVIRSTSLCSMSIVPSVGLYDCPVPSMCWAYFEVCSFVFMAWICSLYGVWNVCCQISKYGTTQQNADNKEKILTPWPESASEQYRPSDRHLSVKFVPTFTDRGCHVSAWWIPTVVFSGFWTGIKKILRYLSHC
jgi:hypothetical protein